MGAGRTGRLLVALLVVLPLASACASDPPSPTAAPASTAPPVTAAAFTASEVAGQFLAKWQLGDLEGAAQLTDAPAQARQELASFSQQLGVTALVLVAGRPAGDDPTLPFTAKVGLGTNGDWTYDSAVPMRSADGAWHVAWSPKVLHPAFTAGATVRVGPVADGGSSVLGRDGSTLDPTALPSLAPILPKVAAAVPPAAGTPGTAVQIVDAAGGVTVLAVLTPAGGSGTKTTLDPTLQAAAEAAVKPSPGPTGLVVLQASTGEILAMANNPPNGQNITTSMQQPGSTMKVVLAAALLRAGDGPGSVVPCPATLNVDGKVFHNDDPNDTNASATLQQDFAVSCNTAFVSEGRSKLSPASLGAEAGSSFGITTDWDIGLKQPRAYASVPDPGTSKTQWAENLIGQGDVTMSPLAMASVAATVATGAFHQPVLLPGAPRVNANGLSPGVAGTLRQMMRSVVTTGTATSLRSVPGDVGAKTGTAEISSGSANGWMIAYRGDLAIACEVLGGGAGDASAGPVVRAFLTNVPN